MKRHTGPVLVEFENGNRMRYANLTDAERCEYRRDARHAFAEASNGDLCAEPIYLRRPRQPEDTILMWMFIAGMGLLGGFAGVMVLSRIAKL